MKKLLTIFVLSLVCAFCAVGLTACDKDAVDKNENTQTEQVGDNTKAELVSAEGFTMEENGGKITVSKDTETFSFLNKITVSDNATWVISQDEYGRNTFATKTAPLYQGDNTFYLIVTSGDGKTINVYNMTVRRIPVYTVYFNSGTSEYYYFDGDIAPQYIEEGYCATEPTELLTKLGCIFKGWDFDFTTPITNYTTINAKWEAKPEMANFEFTATTTTCNITGVKDKTVTETTIPDYVTSIGANAFADCSGLTSITIPDSVTGIGYNAFSGCPIEIATIPAIACSYIKNSNLKTVEITSGNIGNSAFSSCSSLTSIIIPDSVTSIKYGAFYGCDSLQYNEYDNGYYLGNTTNPYVVLVKAKTQSITSCVIYGNTKCICGGAFENCGSLTSITIPDSVMSIGEDSFRYCGSLTSIAIPNSVTSIGYQAFDGCSSLTSVTFTNTSGWRCVSQISGSEDISSSDLANTSTAAQYLKMNYRFCDWERG